MAIYRVVNCWLAVGVLEAKAGRWQPHTRERLAVERCLVPADRRLTAAVKLLATVRRVPVEELQVRVRAVADCPPSVILPGNGTAADSNDPQSATQLK
jgi:hypothetical protein